MTPYDQVTAELTATREVNVDLLAEIAALQDTIADLRAGQPPPSPPDPDPDAPTAEQWAALLALAEAVHEDAITALQAAQPVPPEPEPTPPPAEGLVTEAMLVHVGAFKLPHGTQPGGSSWDYGATALAYRRDTGTLLGIGHDWQQLAAEFTIPTVFPITAPEQIDHLGTAAIVQHFNDVTDGRMMLVTNHPNEDTVKIGGLLVNAAGTHLVATAYIYYDGNGEQQQSHFTSGLDLALPADATGPWKIHATVLEANGTQKPSTGGFVSGYMCWIPEAWRAALGGPALTGNCDLSVISRTSDGPACFAFDPANVGSIDPVPSTTLLCYPDHHPMPSNGPDGTPWNNRTCQCTGLVFPEGTQSVLFFGRMGVGPYSYGEGTADPALDGQPVPGSPGTIYCYDPALVGQKGGHAYPYEYRVWAYDAADLADVKAGTMLPWDVRPYAVWGLALPWPRENAELKGAAYDPVAQRLFVSQAWGDGSYPLIHVFELESVAQRRRRRPRRSLSRGD